VLLLRERAEEGKARKEGCQGETCQEKEALNVNKLLIILAAAVLLSGCVQFPGGSSTQGAGGSAQTGASGSGTSGSSGGASIGDGASTSEGSGTQASDSSGTGTTDSGTGASTSGTSSTGTPATSLKSKEISYMSGAWKIYGTLYESAQKTPTKAIVLVPMLGSTRESYPMSFIEKLHDAFPDAIVVAIDPRGHGKSNNAGTWNTFDMAAFKDMKTDILTLRTKYVELNYPDVHSFYVVGASQGSTSALMAGAQDKTITKVVMISPGMEYRGVDITDAAIDYLKPLMVVSSSGDGYSAEAVSQIRSLSNRPELVVQSYKGTAHGTELFAETEGTSEPLEDMIVEFLK
jgi:pimeloyl-ACP methyl ester carboxylesterase